MDIEQEIQAKGLTAPRAHQQRVVEEKAQLDLMLKLSDVLGARINAFS